MSKEVKSVAQLSESKASVGYVKIAFSYDYILEVPTYLKLIFPSYLERFDNMYEIHTPDMRTYA